MAALGPSCVRHLTGLQAPQLYRVQRRWARVFDVRFVATQHAQDRIVNRYRDKLDQKAKEKGLSDIQELKEAYKDQISTLRKKAAVPSATSAIASGERTSSRTPKSPWPSPPPPPAQPLDQLSPSSPNYKTPGVKTLSSFLDVPKTLDLPSREIESLWRLRHAGSPQSLCASIPASTWSYIAATARQHPQFILPGLPRKGLSAGANEVAEQHEGAPIHFLQWTYPSPDTATVLFTHLAEYKLRAEYAQPHTTITHHLELAGPKGLVLCQGNVIEGRGVSLDEARWLIMCLQKFYNTQSIERLEADGVQGDIGTELNRRRRRLMQQFSEGSSEFKVEDLLEEAERIG